MLCDSNFLSNILKTSVTLERLSTEARILVVKTHYKYGECSKETHKKLRTFLDFHDVLIVIWEFENPRIIHEKQIYPQRVTVWCEF